MAAPQYAIMRFMKYKGPEIGKIEAHDERTKESYASSIWLNLRAGTGRKQKDRSEKPDAGPGRTVLGWWRQ